MAIAILAGRDATEQKQYEWFCATWRDVLLAQDATLDIRIWPNVGNVAEIDFLLVWRHPIGTLKQFTNAKAVQSLGAGVDHIFVDSELNRNTPIARIADPFMAGDIVQYVVAYTLQHIKLVKLWEMNQQKKFWANREPPFTLSHKTIGIMGIGYLGKKAALILHDMGLNVIGWSQSAKEMPGITHYTGDAEFHDFLSKSDLLICMLPLTDKTENILNKNTFAKLPRDAFVINIGRGKHVVDEDLIAALDDGHLSGACLDVFREEPLPPNHPFWSHAKIIVTPHIASVTNPMTAAPQVYENYQRAMSNKALLNKVDIEKGY